MGKALLDAAFYYGFYLIDALLGRIPHLQFLSSTEA